MTPLRFIQADCISIPLADDAADLCFCSPPYEAARTYGIDFKLCGQEWVDWAVPRFMECLRVCCGLVAWVVAGQTRSYRWSATPALFTADLHRAGVFLRNPPIYHRVGIPGSGGPDWLRSDYEWIVCATNRPGKLPWSDNTAMGHVPRWAPGGAMSHRLSDGKRVNQWGPLSGRRGGGRRKASGEIDENDRPSHVVKPTKDWGRGGRMPETRGGGAVRRLGRWNPKGSPASQPAIANPGNIIHCNVGGGAMGSLHAHTNEAPFPQALAEFFVLSFCPPTGLVIDPFSGSGTTVAAAVAYGRRGLGFDIRQSQCELGRKRLGDTQLELLA